MSQDAGRNGGSAGEESVAQTQTYAPGTIVWRDLTVSDAATVSRFYEEVVGWKRSVHPGCDDFNMTSPGSEEPTAGVCYATGSNAGIPPAWLIYVAVTDVAASCRRAEEGGGAIIDGPRPMGHHLFAVVRDPAGAYVGLISCAPSTPETTGS